MGGNQKRPEKRLTEPRATRKQEVRGWRSSGLTCWGLRPSIHRPMSPPACIWAFPHESPHSHSGRSPADAPRRAPPRRAGEAAESLRRNSAPAAPATGRGPLARNSPRWSSRARAGDQLVWGAGNTNHPPDLLGRSRLHRNGHPKKKSHIVTSSRIQGGVSSPRKEVEKSKPKHSMGLAYLYLPWGG